ncbi:MAG: SIMPL domain-containing protein [Chloroflexota bacterium]
MKKRWLWVACILLVLGIIGLSGCDSGGSVSGQITGLSLSGQQQGIWVSGQGKVTAVPDIVTLRLGVQAQEASVSEAQAQAAGAMDKVMTALTSNGVAKKDIQTQNFNITKLTRWDDKNQRQVVTGYQVTNTVTAKIRDTSKAGGIIDDVAAAGGDLTRIDGIDFSVENPSPYYSEARKLAMADAKAKANQLADLAGVGLGKATYITESSYSPPIPSPVRLEMKAAVAAETPISPGETEIITSVQVTFAIK